MSTVGCCQTTQRRGRDVECCMGFSAVMLNQTAVFVEQVVVTLRVVLLKVLHFQHGSHAGTMSDRRVE